MSMTAKTRAEVIRRVIAGESIESIDVDSGISDASMLDALFIAKVTARHCGNADAAANLDDAADFLRSK